MSRTISSRILPLRSDSRTDLVERRECVGGVLAVAGLQRLVEFLSRLLLVNLVGFVFVWTPLVTFAPATFSHWWSALLAALYLLADLAAHLIPGLARGGAILASLQLSVRLQHRAAAIALADLIRRHRESIFGGADPSLAVRGPEPNVVYSMYTFLTAVAGLVVNLAAGGCVVLWTVLLIAYMLFLLFVDLVNLGVANQQISAVTDLYQDAIRDIRELRRAADAASAPHLLSASLRNHDLVLTSYLAVDRYKARLFGAAVSHGLTRTAVVTGFTVALGLWTLLKGAGVTFTMDMACPIS
ncbi:hypothetical protein DFJ74DRAFT_713346 [Hyaloraphidium curvatum]|nr:hypothetical protein DFJ74DRAFT_713346 [Hyaloraphidium curvatum]